MTDPDRHGTGTMPGEALRDDRKIAHELLHPGGYQDPRSVGGQHPRRAVRRERPASVADIEAKALSPTLRRAKQNANESVVRRGRVNLVSVAGHETDAR